MAKQNRGWRVAALLWCAAGAVTAAQAPQVMKVAIDVKPGDSPTTLERGRGGLVPIAILSTAQFDALTVDVETIRVGPTGEETQPTRTSSGDVNEDRRPDLVALVRVQDMEISCATTMIKLTAKTQAGVSIEGSEAVVITGCGRP